MQFMISLNPHMEITAVDNEMVLVDNETQTVFVANEAMSAIIMQLQKLKIGFDELKNHFCSTYEGQPMDTLTADFDEAIGTLLEHKVILKEHVEA